MTGTTTHTWLHNGCTCTFKITGECVPYERDTPDCPGHPPYVDGYEASLEEVEYPDGTTRSGLQVRGRNDYETAFDAYLDGDEKTRREIELAILIECERRNYHGRD
jgi:hypothetical protein